MQNYHRTQQEIDQFTFQELDLYLEGEDWNTLDLTGHKAWFKTLTPDEKLDYYLEKLESFG